MQPCRRRGFFQKQKKSYQTQTFELYCICCMSSLQKPYNGFLRGMKQNWSCFWHNLFLCCSSRISLSLKNIIIPFDITDLKPGITQFFLCTVFEYTQMAFVRYAGKQAISVNKVFLICSLPKSYHMALVTVEPYGLFLWWWCLFVGLNSTNPYLLFIIWVRTVWTFRVWKNIRLSS